MALSRSTDPLVWIDCEMTGLDPASDVILSVSCFVTDARLRLLDETGYHAVIATPKERLEGMSAWCVETHGRTGLTAACLRSTMSAETAAAELRAYIEEHVPVPRTALLAGNSVHVDKLFLLRPPWAAVLECLHYRILDVSAIKEGVRRWCGDSVLKAVPVKKLNHTAKEDVLESIEEARFYMDLFGRLGEIER